MIKKEIEFPDYVLQRKRLSKVKTVIVFRRNNLSISDFKKTENGFEFSEIFTYRGIKISFDFTVKSHDFTDIFKMKKRKAVKVNGSINNFGIFLRFPDQPFLPLDKSCSSYFFKFHLHCYGNKSFGCLSGKQRITADPASQNIIYNTASSNFAHPFQGGGVTPK